MKISRIPLKLRIISLFRGYKDISNIAYVGKNNKFRDLNFIKIGKNFYVGNNCKVLTWKKYNGEETGFTPKLCIGSDVTINDNCFISCMNRIEIGDGCLFGDNVFITDNFHGNSTSSEINIPPKRRKLITKGEVVLGKNIWCGCNVSIMPGVKIGDNVIIGANSVVTHSFEDNVVIAGVPAKVIKKIK